MKVSYLLLISLLIVGTLFVPAVSAYDYSERINLVSYAETYGSLSASSTCPEAGKFDKIMIDKIQNWQNPRMIRVTGTADTYFDIPTTSGSFPVVFKIGSTVIGDGVYGWFKSGGQGYIWVAFDSWDATGYTGRQTVTMVPTNGGTFPAIQGYRNGKSTTSGFDWNVGTFENSDYKFYITKGLDSYSYYTVANERHEVYWTSIIQADITVDKNTQNLYEITVNRNIAGNSYPSYLEIWSGDIKVEDKGTVLESTDKFKVVLDIPISVCLGVPPNVWENRTYYADAVTPTPTEAPTVMRTGSVTMTDNNGTTISDFEVTAVNHYTGEEYTVATDTDVAVMTLPMDRTIEIRNPQTGEYETAPIGYYRFYGQAPGYNMLHEDGIQVSVMPEKYGSYQLCDIRVTSDSDYLSGNHQFQIRSRSDNSILQTGTISAKSATTGEWYNTTVSGGIASLTLPYDTSNVVSQYAGNYYVYATSPGYEDSDYATQIVVMPHTVSEIQVIHLTPIGGIPTPGNVTLRIQAFSETGQGVVNAEIFIAGVIGAGSDVWDTYTASSTGYLTVSVPGNSTYDIVASGAGYYDSARRVEVFDTDPGLIEIKLYLSGAPTVEPTTQPTGWPTTQPTTQPTGGIPDEDDDSDSFLMQAVRGIGLAFGVGFATAKLIFGMLLALSIGYATAKQLRGGAAEFGLGLLGGTLLGVLIGLLPVWIIVVLLLVVGLYIGNRYVGGGNNG